PEAGDDLQWEKAGLLEVADIVVINKGDLPKAEQVEAQVRSMLGLSETRQVPILRVSSKTGEGVESLWSAIEAVPTKNQLKSRGRGKLIQRVHDVLAQWFEKAQKEDQPELQQIVEDWNQAAQPEGAIIRRLLHLFQRDREDEKN